MEQFLCGFSSSAKRFTLLLLCVFAAANVAAASLDEIRDNKRIAIGVDVPYGKMEFYGPDGALAGIDIDVAKHIATSLGVEPAFKTMPFAKLFDALKHGDVDLVISAVTITAERQKTLRFSVPYFDAALQVAVRKTDTGITGIEHLRGKRVGVLKGTVGESFVRKSELVDNDLIRVFDSNPDRIAALTAGSLDAIIMHFSLRDHPTLRTLDKPLSQSYYGVVGRLESGDLIEAVDEVLRGLKRSNELNRIKRKYLD